MEESPYLTGRMNLLEKYGYLPFLGSDDQEYISRLLEVSKLQRFDMGEVIAEEGEIDNWAYIMLYGEVSVKKQGKFIAILDQPGEIFGEMAIIDNQVRSAKVEAALETLCLAINGGKVELMETMERNKFYSVLFGTLTETLSSRLRTTDEELIRIKKQLENYQE